MRVVVDILFYIYILDCLKFMQQLILHLYCNKLYSIYTVCIILNIVMTDTE